MFQRNCAVFCLGFDDEKEDHQLRMYAVQSYLTLLEEEDKLYPQKFLQVMSWVRCTHGQNSIHGFKEAVKGGNVFNKYLLKVYF